MDSEFSKRATAASLSQNIGKNVTLLGEVVQVDPNGRSFTLKASDKDVITVQLEDPVNLRDLELFQENVDEDYDFLLSHMSDFKEMWKDQGQTFWVRVLLSFREYYDDYVHQKCQNFTGRLRNEGERVKNFFYIFIHKQFIEKSVDKAAKFIKAASLAMLELNTLPDGKMIDADPSECDVDLFKSLLGYPSYFKEFPSELIAYAASCFSDFAGIVCYIFAKWVNEPTLSMESIAKLDSSIVYWRPDPGLKKASNHTCFEKYLADYWKKDLPKIIMVQDAHTLFSSFPLSYCCNEIKTSSNIFELIRGEIQCDINLNQIGIVAPYLMSCKIHSNCRILISHKDNCEEPFLCDGGENCELDCEVSLRTKKKPCDASKLIGTMTFEIVKSGKQKKTRTVSTQIGDKNETISTLCYRKEKNLCESGQCEYLALQNLCGQTDYEMRNCYHQRKKKVELKMKLRSKLNKKHSYFEDYFDREVAIKLFQRAKTSWNMDFCEENFQNICSVKDLNLRKPVLFGKSFDQFKKLMTSVVVGTGDPIFGHVVMPTPNSKPPSPNMLNAKLQEFFSSVEDTETVSQTKKTRKRKKKAKASNSDHTIEESCTCEPVKDLNIDSDFPNKIKTEETTIQNKNPSLHNECKAKQISASSDIKDKAASSCKKLNSQGSKTFEEKSLSNEDKEASNYSEEFHVTLTEVVVTPVNSKLKKKAKSANVFVKETTVSFTKKPDLPDKQKEEGSDSEKALTVEEEEAVDKFFELIGLDPNKEESEDVPDVSPKPTSQVSDKKLRVCAFCYLKEVEYKSFKRCGRCKIEKFPVQHYYCSKSCQVKDWEECHRDEHLNSNTTS